MAKRTMSRTAGESRYLHKDFHGALSVGLEYLEQRFGADSVREYLRQFSIDFYVPLKAELIARGLPALKEHFERMYTEEGAGFSIECSGDELVLRVGECPAVSHMRARGYPVSELFVETTRTVNEAICEGTQFCAELLEYDAETGRSVQVFRRKAL